MNKVLFSVATVGIVMALMLGAVTTLSFASTDSSAIKTVNLGTAGNFVILTKTGITTTGATHIVGNIGVSPITSAAMTGFALVLNPAGTFATSALVNGRVYAANYAAPTPAMLTTAVSNMQTAYTNAAGRTNPKAINLGAGDISERTLTPGLYKWTSSLMFNTHLTLNCLGNSKAIFIFQVGTTLTVGSGAVVTLSGGCRASHIFWQVAGQTTLGTTAAFKGIILDKTSIVVMTGATVIGRLFAQTAVTLNANTVKP
jgi:hypothetical protein